MIQQQKTTGEKTSLNQTVKYDAETRPIQCHSNLLTQITHLCKSKNQYFSESRINSDAIVSNNSFVMSGV